LKQTSISTGGNAKKAQIKEFERYFNYKKVGQKFIITEIYNEPLTKVDKRCEGNNKGKDNKNYLIPPKLSTSKGVYIIKDYNDIYIGSTISGFRARYRQHMRNYDNLMPHTQDLLLNGATFNYLWVARDEATEQEIRDMEQHYIDLYKSKVNVNLINKTEVAKCCTFKKANINKNRRIIVPNNQYQRALDILNEYGIKCS
jgi:hypothetical protein